MKQVSFLTICILTASVCLALDFKPPGPAEQQRAIGSTKQLPVAFRRALLPEDNFLPIRMPKAGDWLASHPEAGQTFDDFRDSRSNRPDRRRNKIYLQPYGEFPKDKSPSLKQLQGYAAAYFAMEVMLVLPPQTFNTHDLTTRINSSTGRRQLLSADVLALLKKDLPDDAFCLLAITMKNLYPDPSWNYVFGQASLRARVGVFSFARYHPAFYGGKEGKDSQKLLLRRSGRVLVNETAHMFGLKHCIFFECMMNGASHLQESDSHPLHLCPVCLRKLQFSIEFDIISRYGQLLSFYQRVGFDMDERWIGNRLEWISDDQVDRRTEDKVTAPSELSD